MGRERAAKGQRSSEVSEATLRTNHRLRWPFTFPELLSARIGGIGRLWRVRLIFGWVQRQTWLSLAPQQQVHPGDQVLELLVGSISELFVSEQLLVLG